MDLSLIRLRLSIAIRLLLIIKGVSAAQSVDKMATNQDKELLLEWICPLFV